MVMTPRPRRSAEVFAPSLLTITAGRRLFASLPRAGARSTRQISPRRIAEPVTDRLHPHFLLASDRPFHPGFVVVVFKRGVSEHANRTLQASGARRQTDPIDVFIQHRDFFVREAH